MDLGYIFEAIFLLRFGEFSFQSNIMKKHRAWLVFFTKDKFLKPLSLWWSVVIKYDWVSEKELQ